MNSPQEVAEQIEAAKLLIQQATTLEDIRPAILSLADAISSLPPEYPEDYAG